MWRYFAGGVAALLMVAAGLALWNARARPDSPLPAQPLRASSGDVASQADAPLPDSVPEADPQTREQKRFGRYDKDKDGRVTREEFLTQRRKAFAKLDLNRDGKLSFDEWAAKTTARFDTADRDKSGAMDATEFATTRPKRSAHPRCACPQPAAQAGDD